MSTILLWLHPHVVSKLFVAPPSRGSSPDKTVSLGWDHKMPGSCCICGIDLVISPEVVLFMFCAIIIKKTHKGMCFKLKYNNWQ